MFVTLSAVREIILHFGRSLFSRYFVKFCSLKFRTRSLRFAQTSEFLALPKLNGNTRVRHSLSCSIISLPTPTLHLTDTILRRANCRRFLYPLLSAHLTCFPPLSFYHLLSPSPSPIHLFSH